MPHTATHNGNGNGTHRAPPANLPSARKQTCQDAAPERTPMELLHAATCDAELAVKTLRRWLNDPQSEIHGNLTVALGALRRAAQAIEALLVAEEGGRT
jgi:hypothetical protein